MLRCMLCLLLQLLQLAAAWLAVWQHQVHY
jgi:hypothetical protein